MREPGDLARRATGFVAALATTTGLIALLPQRASQGTAQLREASHGPPGHLIPVLDPADPGPHGPAERHLPAAKREHKDVTFVQLAVGGIGVLFCLACAAGVSWWLYPAPDKTLYLRSRPPVTYPMPTLQDDPVADMNRFRSEQLQQLNGIYWLDKAGGTVHLPIEDAMRIVARDGIPDWPKTPYPPVVPAR